MAYILNIETSTTNCSVSLAERGRRHWAQGRQQFVVFSCGATPCVYRCALKNGERIYRRSLSAIAISKGPGSYTGLRIGVSAAKGLCYALNIPLISVPTLEALAHQVENPKGDRSCHA